MTNWIMSEHGVPDSRLTVIKEVEPHITKGGHKQIQYLCKCECGKEVIVRGAYLRNGNTKSCGCIHNELLVQQNIANGQQIKVGDKFGKLTVIKDLGMRKQKSRDKNWRWSLCQCDCGSAPIEVPNNLLQNGHKHSCGCLGSVGELTIEKILKDNAINYQKEYSFEDLISTKGYKYRFDFAIFDNANNLLYLIEFDGRQHFTGPESSWEKTRTLEEIQMADNIKNEYCKKNNIILKRIPFFEFNNISIETITNNYFTL